MPIISVLRGLWQEDCEFEASYTVRLFLKETKQKNFIPLIESDPWL
jgi:hypothetical protein